MSDVGDHGMLTLITDDAANPRFNIKLSGTAALPSMQVFPPNLDFGSTIYRVMGQETLSECTSATRVVNVYNTGAAPLVISQLEFPTMGDHSDPHFEVVAATLGPMDMPLDYSQPITIPIATAAKITIQFTPVRTAPAVHDGSMIIHHNATPGGTYVVLLTGIGISDGPADDLFMQPPGPENDILWVIDNSCSMFDKQAKLVQNLSHFVDYADAQHADYQMAVTTTDGGSPDAGKLFQCYPYPRIISSSYAQRAQAFACTFLVGTLGPGIERGLAAAMLALERAQDPDQDPVRNPNAGLLRPEASLSIIVVSDEDDQSDQTLDLLRDYFNSVKGLGRTKLYAIAGPVAELCSTRNALPGFRYFQMTEEMGGMNGSQFYNICQADWSPFLSNLGLDVFVPISSWVLSQAADPATLVVNVDGVQVPYDMGNGVTFDARTNSIDFHGSAVPAPGGQIEARYSGSCRP
jgi:hypothetical protein